MIFSKIVFRVAQYLLCNKLPSNERKVIFNDGYYFGMSRFKCPPMNLYIYIYIYITLRKKL